MIRVEITDPFFDDMVELIAKFQKWRLDHPDIKPDNQNNPYKVFLSDLMGAKCVEFRAITNEDIILSPKAIFEFEDADEALLFKLKYGGE